MIALTTRMRDGADRQGTRRHWPIRRLPLLLLVGLALGTPAAAEQPEDMPKPAYRLGVSPYLPALTLDRLYGAVAEAFSYELDRLVKLRTKSTFENFAEALAEESYDIIFVHPFFLVDAIDRYDYRPLARLNGPLRAVLTVREDSRTRTVDDLAGSTIGLPPRLAAASDLLEAALFERGLRPGRDVGIRRFLGKAACLKAVGAGEVAACGVPAFLLDQLDARDRPPLRIVFEAPPISHFAFAVHHRVPAGEERRLRALILGWSSAADNDMARSLGLSQGFVAARVDDYAAVRARKARLHTLAQR